MSLAPLGQFSLGSIEVLFDCAEEGLPLGNFDGIEVSVGPRVGGMLGMLEGFQDGTFAGINVGSMVGSHDGNVVGISAGMVDEGLFW